jgi:signal transduction histidine kinase
LRNLLENARRYGGREVSVVTESRAGRAQVRVCDRGPGVPEAMRERIFESFFRMPGHAEQAGGVGLGLSLVKQIAERHGGSVRCEARDGGGSCFVLSLPLAA